MSHVKSGGKTNQHAQRPGKRLGVKVFGGQKVTTGAIIVRQKGTKFHAGQGVGTGRDYTLFALKNGIVNFKTRLTKQLVSIV